jgi:hypothetical protein
MTGFSIAYIISSHGYGHAARAAAVMLALLKKNPEIHFEVFTQVTPGFFQPQLSNHLTFHREWTDIGLVQNGPFIEDIPATLQSLDDFLSQSSQIIDRLKTQIQKSGCRLVICDIAPIGIAAAAAAGVHSILVENFTWDWIYAGYPEWRSAFAPSMRVFEDWFHQADEHIQTQPVCSPDSHADLLTLPVGRKPLKSKSAVYSSLDIPLEAKTVLITTGGIENQPTFLDLLSQHKGVYFLVPGGSKDGFHIQGNLIAFPHQSDLYHPDLVHACDAVIGKVGYSTIAEVYSAGVPFGYVPRLQFREMGPLVEFIQQYIPGLQILPAAFASAAWLDNLDELFSLPRMVHDGPDGAGQIADFILNRAT